MEKIAPSQHFEQRKTRLRLRCMETRNLSGTYSLVRLSAPDGWTSGCEVGGFTSSSCHGVVAIALKYWLPCPPPLSVMRRVASSGQGPSRRNRDRDASELSLLRLQALR